MKKIANILIILGVLCICAALAITIYNVCDIHRAEKSVYQILAKMPEIPETSQPETKQEIWKLRPDMDMPTIEIDGNYYIGTLNIPNINLKLPVMKSWSYPNLKISPCGYSGSVYKKNMVIAGHNYPSHFGSLRLLEKSDTVIFTDADGNAFSYIVDAVDILHPEEVKEMESGEWDLTLFTCTKGAADRVTIRCILKED